MGFFSKVWQYLTVDTSTKKYFAFKSHCIRVLHFFFTEVEKEKKHHQKENDTTTIISTTQECFCVGSDSRRKELDVSSCRSFNRWFVIFFNSNHRRSMQGIKNKKSVPKCWTSLRCG